MTVTSRVDRAFSCPVSSLRELPWIGPLLLLLLLAAPGAAQDPAVSLQKSHIIRILAESSWTEHEVVDLIRRRCLSFRPTDRDIQDFRSLGAGEKVIQAIRECEEDGASSGLAPILRGRDTSSSPATSRGERPAPDPPPNLREGPRSSGRDRPSPPPAGEEKGAMSLSLDPRRIVTAPGTGTDVTVDVTAGRDPVAGVSLVLREGGRARAAAETDARGRATFRVPSGYRPGDLRRFSIVGLSEPLVGDSVVRVETVAIRATRRPHGEGEDAVARAEGAAARPPLEEDDLGREFEPGALSGDSTAPESEEAASKSVLSSLLPAGRASDVLPGRLPRREDPEREAKRVPPPPDRPDRTSRGEGSVLRMMDGLREEALVLRVEQARREALQGAFERAGALLAEVEAQDPGRRDVRRLRAYLALRQGDLEEARRRFRELVREDPEDAEAWRGLARALSRSGREEEAREAYRRAREVAGSEP